MRLLCLALPFLLGLSPQSARSKMEVWDTGSRSARQLTSSEIAQKKGWKELSRGATAKSFRGDAVFSNGRILGVLRRQSAELELYSVTPEGTVPRAGLHLQAKGVLPAARLESVSLSERTRSAVRLEAVYRTAKGGRLQAQFRLKRGEVLLETAPGKGAERLRLSCPGRFVILPDFFADDIVLDARETIPSRVDIPSEHFLVHPTAGGRTLAMAIFENREQDVRLRLEGSGDDRKVASSEIRFGKGRKIWVALLEGRGAWHARDLEATNGKKVVPLDWTMPFPAQWRADFTRDNGLTDSWEILLQDKEGGSFRKPTTWTGRTAAKPVKPDRGCWATVLGRYTYPVWTDHRKRGFVQPFARKQLRFQGPLVVYPMNRVAETPPEIYTVVDVVRNALGVGPCQYILDVEGQKEDNKGRATCATRTLLKGIFSKGQQRQRRTEVDQALDKTLTFVRYIRGRIGRYVAFGKDVRAYLAAQRKARPELGKFLDEMDAIAAEIDARVRAREGKIKTPDDVVRMNEEFRKNILNDGGSGAYQKCKDYGDALVEIGGNQDELVGECRWVAKALRQRAGLLMAMDPRCAAIAAEIRARAQKVLRNPAVHEGARH